MQNLNGLTVMVTRPKPQGEILCGHIQAAGGCAIYFPTIEIHPPKDTAAFEKNIAALDQYAWVIFSSPQAVYHSAQAIHHHWPQFPPTVKVAALGGGTAEALRQAQLPIDIYPIETHWHSEGLLDNHSFQNLFGKKIALISGEGGRDFLEKTLITRGASVTVIISYQRCLPDLKKTAINNSIKLLQAHRITIIICTSGEILHNLKLLLESAWPELRKIPLIVISARMALLAKQLAFETIILAKNGSLDALMDTLKDYLCQMK